MSRQQISVTELDNPKKIWYNRNNRRIIIVQKHVINTENWSQYKIGTLFQSNKKRIPSGCDIPKAKSGHIT